MRRDSQQALDYYRAISPREDAPRIDTGAKPQRVHAESDPGNTEAPVLRAISQLLARHPRVHIAIRHNSGALFAEADGGVARKFVWFNKLLRGRGVLVDFTGTLIDGKPFALEAKKPDWKMPGPDARSDSAIRAREQSLYLEHVRAVGGVAGFVRSVDEALALLGPQSDV